MKLKLVGLLVVIVNLFSPVAVAQMFAGYDSLCNLPVIVGSDPQLATARVDNSGNPYIHVDPAVMSNWTTSRIFVLAHECAHHLLGHTTSLGKMQRFRGGTKQQEMKADCWAAKVLLDAGYTADITRTILEWANKGHFSASGYPSGIERAKNISNCVARTYCREVQVEEEYIAYEWLVRSIQVPCQHYGCDWLGRCEYAHPFDFTQTRVQLPVHKTKYVTKELCQ